MAQLARRTLIKLGVGIDFRSMKFLTRSYRSAYSLEKLYPNSFTDSKSISVPINPSKESDQEFNGFLPIDKLRIDYDLQNSKTAEIRFQVKECDWLPAKIRDKFFKKFKHRIDKDGFFCVRSSRTTVASMNLADCLDKLRFSIRECADEEVGREVHTKEQVEELRRKQEIEAKKRLQVKNLVK